MSDRRDQVDDPIESELRSWFKSQGTPAAPSTLRAFADQVGSGTRPTAPLRGLAVGWRSAPGGRLAAVAASIAIVVLAGGLLLVAGQRGPAAPTSSPGTSQPAAGSPHPTGSPAVGTPVDDGGTFGASGLWAVAGGQLYLSDDFGATWVQRALVPASRSMPPRATRCPACSCSTPTTPGRPAPGPARPSRMTARARATTTCTSSSAAPPMAGPPGSPPPSRVTGAARNPSSRSPTPSMASCCCRDCAEEAGAWCSPPRTAAPHGSALGARTAWARSSARATRARCGRATRGTRGRSPARSST